ncbi:MAG: InlB B-repeat-containing protein [Butyrivibrio sp.]|nr:InlB B-repeat-containing protein [Butyrivibrio sp.]
MKKKLLGRILSIVLSVTMAFGPSVTAFAEGEVAELVQDVEKTDEEIQGEEPEEPEVATPEVTEPSVDEPEAEELDEEEPEAKEEEPVAEENKEEAEEPEAEEELTAAEEQVDVVIKYEVLQGSTTLSDVIFNFSEIKYTNIKPGGKIGGIKTPVKAFYVFKGWTPSYGTIEEDSENPGTYVWTAPAEFPEDTTLKLTGQMEPKTYKVHYFGIEKADEDIQTKAGVIELEPLTLDDPEKVFEGWYVGKDATGTKFTAPTETNPNWTYTLSEDEEKASELSFYANIVDGPRGTVTYAGDDTYTNDVANLKEFVAYAGKTLTFKEPEKAYYDFYGWYYDEELTMQLDKSGDDWVHVISASELNEEDGTFAITIYPKFLAASLKLTYNENAGENQEVYLNTIYTTVYYDGKYPEEFPNAQSTGFFFGGWYSDKECTKKINGGDPIPKEIPEGGLVAYAKWTEVDFTFNFHTNIGKDAKVTKKNVKISSDAVKETLDPAVILKGKLKDTELAKITGWMTTGCGAATTQTIADLIAYIEPTAAKMTVDVYAQWPESTDTYTIEFDAGTVADFDAADFAGSVFTVGNENDLVQSQQVYVGQNYILTGTEFVRKGYTLTGWKYGKKTIKPTATIKDLVKKGETAKLTAIWKGPVSYSVKFVMVGGKYTGKKLPSKYTYAKPYTLPTAENMKKTGYKFMYWVVNEPYGSGTTTIGKGSSNLETGNATLYAYWDPIIYNINIDLDGGSIVSGPVLTGTMLYGEALPLKGLKCQKPGYKFKNWTYTNDAGKTVTVKANGSLKNLTKVQDKVVTVKANWTPVKYKLSFDLQGGTLKKLPKTYTNKDAGKVLFGIPTRTGYVFMGWSVSQKGVTNGRETVRVSEVRDKDDKFLGCTVSAESYGDATLTAVWHNDEYELQIMDATGEKELTPSGLKGVGIPYTAEIDLTEIAAEISKSEDFTKGKSIKGFALTTKDAGKGSVKYGLNNLVKISVLVSGTKAINNKNVIKLYAVEEAEKSYILTYKKIDGDYVEKRAFYYDPTKDYTLPVPTEKGYVFTGWKKSADGVNLHSEEDLPGVEGTDYYIDTKTGSIAIMAGSEAFNSVVLIATFVPVKYNVLIMPGADGVKAGEGDAAVTVPKTGMLYKKGDPAEAVKVAYNDYSALLEGVTLVRPGYTLKGYSATAGGELLFGGLTPQLGRLTVDKDGNAKIYAIWQAAQSRVFYGDSAYVTAKGGYTGNVSVYFQNSTFKNVTGGTIEPGYFYFHFTSYGKDFTLPTIKKTGYKWLGWKEVLGEGEQHNPAVTLKNGYAVKITKKNVANVKLQACFEEYTFNLYFNPNGGSFKGSKKSVLLAKNVRYSQNVAPILTEKLELNSYGNIDGLVRAGYNAPSVFPNPYYNLSFAKKEKIPSIGNITEAIRKKWIWYGGIPDSHCTINKTDKSVTLYCQWEKVKVTKPANIRAFINEDKNNAGKNEIIVEWDGESTQGMGMGRGTRYEIQYSTSPLFLYDVKNASMPPMAMVGQSSMYAKASGLTGTRYYARVRGYVTDSSGKKIYSKWTNTVSVVRPNK